MEGTRTLTNLIGDLATDASEDKEISLQPEELLQKKRKDLEDAVRDLVESTETNITEKLSRLQESSDRDQAHTQDVQHLITSINAWISQNISQDGAVELPEELLEQIEKFEDKWDDIERNHPSIQANHNPFSLGEFRDKKYTRDEMQQAVNRLGIVTRTLEHAISKGSRELSHTAEMYHLCLDILSKIVKILHESQRNQIAKQARG